MTALIRSYNPSKLSMFFGFTELVDGSTLTDLKWLISIRPSALIAERQWKPQIDLG